MGLAYLLKPANVKELDAILTYHVVSGVAAFSKDLTDGEKIKTVEGQSVVAHVSAAGVMINDATVQTADIAASNGVVHIIDTVLSIPDYKLHHVDAEDHKCFEATSAFKFASKGITDSGPCPASYNTVDKSVVVEQCPDGVTSIRYCSPINVTIDTKGEAMMMAEVADDYKLHSIDAEDHKCFEATSASKFASKGITDSGPCPASYNTVDKSVVVEQCPDGVTSIRYCSPINVTIDTKGEAMVAEVVDKAQCSKDTDCPSSYCNNGFCHGCFDKCCQTTSDCTKKGLGYCQNDSTKMPPYFCHA